MGKLVLAGIVPHPPIMVAEVGKGEIEKVAKTREGMKRLALELEKERPETLVILTPHGAVFSDAITISVPNQYQGDLSNFGASQVQLNYQVDFELADLILKSALERKIPIAILDEDLARDYEINLKLDHGIVAPLSFFDHLEPKPWLLQINMGFLAREELYNFGMALREGILQSRKRVAVIASSDLSHRIIPGAPGGYSLRGKEFDQMLVEKLREFDVAGILSIPEDLQEEAGECGYRTILMLLGALEGEQVESQILSYEAPFGVGYLVANLEAKGLNSDANRWQDIIEQKAQLIINRKSNESPIVQLARKSLEYFYQKGELVADGERFLDNDYPKRAGVFVTLKQAGQLRGCIGTIEPTEDTLAGEVIANAIKAATQDPRFEPVDLEELDSLTISVDVLEAPETISGMEELDPQIYGVIVQSGRKRGLLLPALEGINTPQEQVSIASQKAGIRPGESIKLERFRVTRHI